VRPILPSTPFIHPHILVPAGKKVKIAKGTWLRALHIVDGVRLAQ